MKAIIKKIIILCFFTSISSLIWAEADDSIFESNFNGSSYMLSNTTSFIDNNQTGLHNISFENNTNFSFCIKGKHTLSINIPFLFLYNCQYTADEENNVLFLNIESINLSYNYLFKFESFSLKTITTISFPTNYNLIQKRSSGTTENVIINTLEENNNDQLKKANNTKLGLGLSFILKKDPFMLFLTPSITFPLYNFDVTNIGLETSGYFLINSSIDFIGKNVLQISFLNTIPKWQTTDVISAGIVYNLNTSSKIEGLVSACFITSRVLPGFSLSYKYTGKVL